MSIHLMGLLPSLLLLMAILFILDFAEEEDERRKENKWQKRS